ncbi:MAG TPA: hypothetical protein VF796_08055 [Humisphaera sp.]
MPYPRLFAAVCLPLLSFAAFGCQAGQAVKSQKLIEHQALVSVAGLKPAEAMDDVNVRASIPDGWSLGSKSAKLLYANRHYRSPSGRTGVGVVHAKVLIPVSPKVVLWMARQQYQKQGSASGRELRSWEDALGRHWFEAENDQFRVTGYAMVEGRDVWLVYSGFKLDAPTNWAEVADGLRAMETFVPLSAGPVPAAGSATVGR